MVQACGETGGTHLACRSEMGMGTEVLPLAGRCIQYRQETEPAGAVSASASMICCPGRPVRVRLT